MIFDLTVYGFRMAALCLATFTLIVLSWGNGDLGMNCNADYSDSCDTVFRAQASTFAVMT